MIRTALPHSSHPPDRSVRFARYAAPDEPPVVDELSDEAGVLIDTLFMRVADCSSVPAIAAREIIENLVHADFKEACISVLDGGATVRVSDGGPGISDKDRALEVGFSTATAEHRTIVRGVGSGLPVSVGAMRAVGGSLEIDDNLDTGTVVTLRAPAGTTVPIGQEMSAHARTLLALLVELGPSDLESLAGELGIPRALASRELIFLEHRGYVDRAVDGTRDITDAGTTLLTTLF